MSEDGQFVRDLLHLKWSKKTINTANKGDAQDRGYGADKVGRSMGRRRDDGEVVFKIFEETDIKPYLDRVNAEKKPEE